MAMTAAILVVILFPVEWVHSFRELVQVSIIAALVPFLHMLFPGLYSFPVDYVICFPIPQVLILLLKPVRTTITEPWDDTDDGR